MHPGRAAPLLNERIAHQISAKENSLAFLATGKKSHYYPALWLSSNKHVSPLDCTIKMHLVFPHAPFCIILVIAPFAVATPFRLHHHLKVPQNASLERFYSAVANNTTTRLWNKEDCFPTGPERLPTNYKDCESAAFHINTDRITRPLVFGRGEFAGIYFPDFLSFEMISAFSCTEPPNFVAVLTLYQIHHFLGLLHLVLLTLPPHTQNSASLKPTPMALA